MQYLELRGGRMSSIEKTGDDEAHQPRPDAEEPLRALTLDVDSFITAEGSLFRAECWAQSPAHGRGFDRIAKLFAKAVEDSRQAATSGAYEEGFEAGARAQAAEEGIPEAFRKALSAGASDETHKVTIDGLSVTFRVTGPGTGVTDPASGPAWHKFQKVVRRIAAEAPTVAAAIAPDLPKQIRDARWTTARGSSVRVVGHPMHRKPSRSKWPLGLAAWLLPAGWVAAMTERAGSPAMAMFATAGAGTVVATATAIGIVMPAQSATAHQRPPSISQEGFMPPPPRLVSESSPEPTPSPTKTRKPTRNHQSAPVGGAPGVPTPSAAPSPSPVPSVPPVTSVPAPAVTPPAVQGVPTSSPPVAVPTDPVPVVPSVLGAPG